MTDPYLEISDLHPDPLNQFATWYAEACAHTTGLAHAMSLATVDKRGRPAARMVLLSEFGPQGFSFYSHYQSRKGLEMYKTPYAALVFYWRELDQQIRVEGKVVKAPDEQSDTYFATRSRESQLWAWASPQSTEMKNRQELLGRFDEFSGRFGEDEIPRPPAWGGYLVLPDHFEFWAARPGRLHDRFAYDLQDETWSLSRLAP